MSESLKALLRRYRDGEVGEEQVLRRVSRQPYEEHLIGRIDHQREDRTGIPEAILAEGKRPGDVRSVIERYVDADRALMATRITSDILAEMEDLLPRLDHYEEARVVATRAPIIDEERESVLVISAGTLDRPVAREVAVCSRLLGNPTQELFDVGVAGLGRLLADMDRVDAAGIVVVVAGMDGALPSVISGLSHQPIIAVPTSVGYGAAFEGVAPLLTMLNACSPGVAVMNIDNGFGAAALATKINQFGQRMVASHRHKETP